MPPDRLPATDRGTPWTGRRAQAGALPSRAFEDRLRDVMSRSPRSIRPIGSLLPQCSPGVQGQLLHGRKDKERPSRRQDASSRKSRLLRISPQKTHDFGLRGEVVKKNMAICL